MFFHCPYKGSGLDDSYRGSGKPSQVSPTLGWRCAGYRGVTGNKVGTLLAKKSGLMSGSGDGDFRREVWSLGAVLWVREGPRAAGRGTKCC